MTLYYNYFNLSYTKNNNTWDFYSRWLKLNMQLAMHKILCQAKKQPKVYFKCN